MLAVHEILHGLLHGLLHGHSHGEYNRQLSQGACRLVGSDAKCGGEQRAV
jgi:hypothetical protein